MIEKFIEMNKLAESFGLKEAHMFDEKIGFMEISGEEDERTMYDPAYYFDPNVPDQDKKNNEFREKIGDVIDKEKIPMLRPDLKPFVNGKKLPSGLKAKSLLDSKAETVELSLKPGTVTLLLFSAKDSGFGIEKVSRMVMGHPEWKDQLRLIAINYTSNQEEAMELVDKSAVSWELYSVSEAEKAWKDIGLSSHSEAILVGKDSIMQSLSLAHMYLEEYLTQFMNGKTITMPDAIDKTYTYDKAKSDVKEFIKANIEDIKKMELLLYEIHYYKYLSDGKLVDIRPLIEFNCTWTKPIQETFDKLNDSLKKAFSSKIAIMISDKERKMYTLEFGSKCSKCGKELGATTQYKCILCKPEVYFCPQCVESHKDPKSPTDLVHPHPLYYIQKEAAASMSSIFYGKLKIINPFTKKHGSCLCDCCRETPIGLRWKCVICRDVDLCSSCFKISRNPADPKYKEITDKALEVGHDVKTHIYTRQEFTTFINYYA